MAKRIFDLAFASAGLLLSWPVMLLIAVVIKIDSRGPVLFRQLRVGQAGRTFRIHKFRTMQAQAAGTGLQVTVGDDSRITRVGRFLRRYRLDELPQLIDVLLGQMSIVGPRPEVPRYVALYPAELKERVLAVRPGLTDPATLAFIDESEQLAGAADPEREYVDVILPRKLRLQAEYAARSSLRSDLGLLLRTVRALLAR